MSENKALQLSSASLVADILAPMQSRAVRADQVTVESSSGEESYSDDDQFLPSATPTSLTHGPPPRHPPLPVPPRPQVGNKTPKSSFFPPKKCINVYCKEEKQALQEENVRLKAEIEDCKYM